jgi:hypothetical protein
MKFESKRDLYRSAIIDWLNRNDYKASEHIIDVTISVLFTRDAVLMGGDFAKALCNNDLFATIRYADREVSDNLKTIILAYHNISIAEYLSFYSPNQELAARYLKDKLSDLKI